MARRIGARRGIEVRCRHTYQCYARQERQEDSKEEEEVTQPGPSPCVTGDVLRGPLAPVERLVDVRGSPPSHYSRSIRAEPLVSGSGATLRRCFRGWRATSRVPAGRVRVRGPAATRTHGRSTGLRGRGGADRPSRPGSAATTSTPSSPYRTPPTT